MSIDKDLRGLERAAASGDASAMSKLLTLKVRIGELNIWNVKHAASLGDQASLMTTSPSSPRNVHANYASEMRGGFESLGFNDVDGVIGHLFKQENLMSIGVEFIQHAAKNVDAISPVLSNAILLAQRFVSFLKKSVHGPMRIERRAMETYRDISMLEIHDESESQVRWALAYLYRMAYDPGTPAAIDLVWVAIHCRMARGDGSPESQTKELAWQRQHLIDWLLHTPLK